MSFTKTSDGDRTTPSPNTSSRRPSTTTTSHVPPNRDGLRLNPPWPLAGADAGAGTEVHRNANPYLTPPSSSERHVPTPTYHSTIAEIRRHESTQHSEISSKPVQDYRRSSLIPKTVGQDTLDVSPSERCRPRQSVSASGTPTSASSSNPPRQGRQIRPLNPSLSRCEGSSATLCLVAVVIFTISTIASIPVLVKSYNVPWSRGAVSGVLVWFMLSLVLAIGGFIIWVVVRKAERYPGYDEEAEQEEGSGHDAESSDDVVEMSSVHVEERASSRGTGSVGTAGSSQASLHPGFEDHRKKGELCRGYKFPDPDTSTHHKHENVAMSKVAGIGQHKRARHVPFSIPLGVIYADVLAKQLGKESRMEKHDQSTNTEVERALPPLPASPDSLPALPPSPQSSFHTLSPPSPDLPPLPASPPPHAAREREVIHDRPSSLSAKLSFPGLHISSPRFANREHYVYVSPPGHAFPENNRFDNGEIEVDDLLMSDGDSDGSGTDTDDHGNISSKDFDEEEKCGEEEEEEATLDTASIRSLGRLGAAELVEVVSPTARILPSSHASEFPFTPPSGLVPDSLIPLHPMAQTSTEYNLTNPTDERDRDQQVSSTTIEPGEEDIGRGEVKQDEAEKIVKVEETVKESCTQDNDNKNRDARTQSQTQKQKREQNIMPESPQRLRRSKGFMLLPPLPIAVDDDVSVHHDDGSGEVSSRSSRLPLGEDDEGFPDYGKENVVPPPAGGLRRSEYLGKKTLMF